MVQACYYLLFLMTYTSANVKNEFMEKKQIFDSILPVFEKYYPMNDAFQLYGMVYEFDVWKNLCSLFNMSAPLDFEALCDGLYNIYSEKLQEEIKEFNRKIGFDLELELNEAQYDLKKNNIQFDLLALKAKYYKLKIDKDIYFKEVQNHIDFISSDSEPENKIEKYFYNVFWYKIYCTFRSSNLTVINPNVLFNNIDVNFQINKKFYMDYVYKLE